MRLNQLFSAIAVKTLSSVDIVGLNSHQHEINGVSSLRSFFNTSEKYTGVISWFVFTDNNDRFNYSEQVTFYDAREKSFEKTGRSEWRMYYSGDFIKHASPGDFLILLRTQDGRNIGLIIQEESQQLDPLLSIFDLDKSELTNQFHLITSDILIEELTFIEQQFLEAIEIEIDIPEDKEYINLAQKELQLAKQHKKAFPTTSRLAELARNNIDLNIKNPDDLLSKLIEVETKIFKSIESIVVEEKLIKHFENVNEFISYSLSVQNRRKSRMGFALQNHLSYVLTENNILFDSQKKTEGKNTPDFIFPGITYYHEISFDKDKLSMLAAKSTCKERWRQILTEANRIDRKHLCTLDTGITLDQIIEMGEKHVQLVIPTSTAKIYGDNFRPYFQSVSSFISEMHSKQTQI